MDGGVRPRVYPVHAGLRSGRHSVQHAGFPHHVLHRPGLRQEPAAGGWHAAGRGRRPLRPPGRDWNPRPCGEGARLLAGLFKSGVFEKKFSSKWRGVELFKALNTKG